MKRKNNEAIKNITITALIAALYVVLTLISASFGLSYLSFQIRLSEMLTILPVFSPHAILGLTIGCFFSNLASPLGMIDVIFGTLSTFISAHLTRLLSKITFKKVPILAPLPPVVLGATTVGSMLAILIPKEFSFKVFLISFLSVSFGQFIVCYGLSLPLFLFIKKLRIENFL